MTVVLPTLIMFNPQVLDPQQTALVTLGSVKNLLLEGGPLPWILDTSSYFERGEVDYYSLVAFIDHVMKYIQDITCPYSS